MCWDQGSLPRRSAYQLFLVSRPNRTSVWCWTYKNVLLSPTHGFCFSFFPFFDCTIRPILHLVSKYIGIFGAWVLKGSIQRDAKLTSLCSLAAEVLHVVVVILYLCFQSAVFKMSCRENSLRARMLRFYFDHCHGPGGQILSVLCLSPLLIIILRFWREDEEGKGKKERTVKLDPAATLAHLLSVYRV